MNNEKRTFARLGIVLLIMAASCLQSCKKNNSTNTNPNVNTNATISATIAGTNWQSTIAVGTDSTGAGEIVILGFDNNAVNSLFILFPDHTGSGTTLNCDSAQKSSIYYTLKGSTSSYVADPSLGGSGSITITKYDQSSKRVEGTFTCIAKNTNGDGSSKNITNGKFALNYK